MYKITLLIAVALVAASCGDNGTTASTLESLDAVSSATMPPVDTNTSPPSTAGDPTDTTAPDGLPPAAPVEIPDSDYPDVVVADLAGGEVNLKELVLEAEPVLLWFWAPH